MIQRLASWGVTGGESFEIARVIGAYLLLGNVERSRRVHGDVFYQTASARIWRGDPRRFPGLSWHYSPEAAWSRVSGLRGSSRSGGVSQAQVLLCISGDVGRWGEDRLEQASGVVADVGILVDGQ